ncbi:MAG: ATP synthase subunit I [Acidimicrobiales bacterium]
MFAHFSLPNVPDVARRTVSTVLVAGVAALVACIAFGQPLLGLGACIGLGLGTLNFRMVGNSVTRVSARPDANTRRPLALNTMGRMGIITVVTIGLLFVSPSLGFGVLGGLAIFQIILLVNVARSMAKAGPMTSVDEVISANVVEDNIVRADPRPLARPADDAEAGE